MMYAHGNPPLISTQAQQTNPTTSVMLAEVLSLGGESNGNGVNYEARVIIGCSTTTQEFWVEHCQSSALSTSALRQGAHQFGRLVLYGTVQSAQYNVRFRAESGDRLRVRLGAGLTGTAAAKLIVEGVP